MQLDIIKKARRIITIARKPDNDEFTKIAKITGMGMAAIGILGFIISVIFSLI